MNIGELSVSELRTEAKERGIKGYSSMKKQELIDAISELAKAEAPAQAKAPVKPAPKAKTVKEKETAPVSDSEAVKPEPKPAEPGSEPVRPAMQRPAEQRSVEQRPVEQRPIEQRPIEQRPYDQRPAQSPMEARPMEPGRRPPVSGDQRGGYSQGQRGYQQGDQRGGYSQNRPYQQGDQRGGYSQGQRGYQQGDQRGGYSQSQRPYTQGERSYSQGERPYQQPEQRPYDEDNTARRPAMTIPASDGRITTGSRITAEERNALDPDLSPDIENLDSGETKSGILEIMPEGYGFIRCENFLPGEQDVYVAPAQLKRFGLKTGDIVTGNTKIKSPTEKFSALLYIKTINGYHPSEALKRPKFEDMTPIFPNERLRLETPGCEPSLRIVDLLSPIGKGQRGMIVSQPKAGKTTLLKQIAKALTINNPNLHIIILLIDERPEEVTDIKESIRGSRVEVIHSTFDLPPENHKRVSEMVIERARRLVEHKEDVVILLDSITRLARAYNLTCTPSGRTLSGGLDPAALHMPKKFFGAARNMREGGSLTILATALVDTGSRMDDVVFEEFKGTGNMELVLDRNLSERRIFPAIDLPKSGTRRDDLLLTDEELEANLMIRRAFNSARSDEAVERIINLFYRTKSNREFIDVVRKTKLL